jgi:pSer/pThr/pTyr-binding forkhead associated (FHA) protein
MTNFELQDDKDLIPNISLKVTKQGKEVEHLDLKYKSFYLIGRLSSNDVVMRHPSVSQVHAVIIIDQTLGP